MDKRTFIYILIASATLFGVNWYFEQQNAEAVKEWKAQIESKNVQKIKALSEHMSKKTASLSSLPVIELEDGSKGLLIKGNVIAFSQKDEVAFTKDGQTQKLKKIFGNDRFSVYGSGPLRVADLPGYGSYDVQLFIPETDSVLAGEYVDGQFTTYYEQLQALKEEKANIPPSIALVKIENEYLPVAIFNKKFEWLDRVEGLKTLMITREGKETPGEKAQEKFFVLQNGYQQLVFSNYGGALAEINLPFQAKSDKESVVKEIEIDRQMVKTEPQNAHFPAHSFTTSDNIYHEKGQLGGYYPLIRRDLIAKPPAKSVRVSPKYYALNIISDYPEVAELVYEVKSFTDNEIVFESNQSLRKITKRYSIEKENEGGPYTLNLQVNVEGDSRGLWLTSGVPEVEWISGSPAPALKYRITKNKTASVENIDLPKDALTITSIDPDWIANSNGFLGIILDPLQTEVAGFKAQFIPGPVVPSRLVEIDEQYNKYPIDSLPGYMTMLPVKGGTTNFRVFAGPFATSILKEVDKTYSDHATGYNPDYIASQTFHGWFAFISEPFAKFLLILMTFFHWLTGSWAFSIILLTVALRIMLYPLNAWSLKSTIQMQKIAPEIAAIQERNKKDPKKAQMEIVNLYRERGINPLSGCFPLLIQMPFLIGMFDLLKSTFELRGASFIPGWIDNLAAPDVLFSWGYPLPFIGNEFHLLPFILGGVMFLQQKMMSPLPKDQSTWTDQQRQQRTMGTMMTFLFTFMFYHFPSGLNIYWLSSMLLGILQQWWTTKRMKNVPAPVKTKK